MIRFNQKLFPPNTKDMKIDEHWKPPPIAKLIGIIYNAFVFTRLKIIFSCRLLHCGRKSIIPEEWNVECDSSEFLQHYLQTKEEFISHFERTETYRWAMKHLIRSASEDLYRNALMYPTRFKLADILPIFHDAMVFGVEKEIANHVRGMIRIYRRLVSVYGKDSQYSIYSKEAQYAELWKSNLETLNQVVGLLV